MWPWDPSRGTRRSPYHRPPGHVTERYDAALWMARRERRNLKQDRSDQERVLRATADHTSRTRSTKYAGSVNSDAEFRATLLAN